MDPTSIEAYRVAERRPPPLVPLRLAPQAEDATAAIRWRARLDPEKKRALAKLHILRPAWSAIILFLPAMWAAAIFVMERFPHWTMQIAGTLAIGTALQAMGILTHDAIHGTLFRRRSLDRWVGTLLGVPSLLTYHQYGIPHWIHHREVRGKKDPDEIWNLTSRPRLLSFAFYAWLLIGMAYYNLRMPLLAHRLGTASQRRQHLVEQMVKVGIIVAVLGVLFHFDVMYAVGIYWLVPMGTVTLMFGNVRGWSEHWTTGDWVHPLRHTHTVISNRLVSFLNCNLNYHLEHHLFPSVPWYNLPKVRALLRDEYRESSALIEPSFTRLVWKTLRIGLSRPVVNETVMREAA